MVLQQTHSIPKSRPRVDATRILGISSTLALNVLALSFLLMPMTLPDLPVIPKPDLIVVDITTPPPVTPRPPEVVNVVKPQPRPQPTIRQEAVQPPAVDVPILVDDGIPFVETVSDLPPVSDTTPVIEPAGPVTGMQLEYVKATPPPYPVDAIAKSLQGVVMLRVLVGVDGKPVEVSIEKSSGHRLLDREAQRHVLRHWTFRPATRDGQPVQAIGIVPIDFKLDRG